MSENVVLEYLLEGISTLETKAELDAVKDAVKDRLEKLRSVLEEEIDPLASGNSDEMIRVNKEKFDYSGVKESDRLMAEKWYMATKPSAGPAYHQWRVWNVPYNYGNEGNEGKKNDKYKGDLIIEKATGRSVSPPPWAGEEEEEEVEEEVTETTEAMAAVRVE